MSPLVFFFRAVSMLFIGIEVLIPAVSALYASQMTQDVAEARSSAKGNQVEERAFFLESYEDKHTGSAVHKGGCCDNKADVQKKDANPGDTNAGDAQKEDSKKKDAQKASQALNKEKREFVKEHDTAQIGSLSSAFHKTSSAMLGSYSGTALRATLGKKTSMAEEYQADAVANSTVVASASKATPKPMTELVVGGLGWLYGHQIGIPMDKWLGPVTSATYILRFAGEMLCGGYRVPTDDIDHKAGPSHLSIAQPDASEQKSHQCLDPNVSTAMQKQPEQSNFAVKLGNSLIYIHWRIGQFGTEKKETSSEHINQSTPPSPSAVLTVSRECIMTNAEEFLTKIRANFFGELYKHSRRLGLLFCWGVVVSLYLPPYLEYLLKKRMPDNVRFIVNLLNEWDNWVGGGFASGVVFSWVFHATDPVYQHYSDVSEKEGGGKRGFWNNLYFTLEGAHIFKSWCTEAVNISVAWFRNLFHNGSENNTGAVAGEAQQVVQAGDGSQAGAVNKADDFWPFVWGTTLGVLSANHQGLSWSQSISDKLVREKVTTTEESADPTITGSAQQSSSSSSGSGNFRSSRPPRPKSPPTWTLFGIQFVLWLLYLLASLIFYYGTLRQPQDGVFPTCFLSLLTRSVMTFHSMKVFTSWFENGTTFVSCYQVLESLLSAKPQVSCGNSCCAWAIGGVMGVDFVSQLRK